MNIKNKNIGLAIISLCSILGIVAVFMLDPIKQNIGYHIFIDRRTLLGIPNFWNVISNIPFLLVGILGLYSIFISRRMVFIAELKTAYTLFFAGVSLVAFGSGYYHLWPENSSLVWDRLPMTIAFMALFSIIVGEFTSVKFSKYALWPLVFFGIFSVFYWHITEKYGAGDLRLYILVQFLPILIIPLILCFFNSKYTYTNGYWYLLIAYIVAKGLEHFDEVVNTLLFSLSGHSLKHVVAALGILFLLRSYNTRKLI